MTLSPCHTLQIVIQTQKCVPCRECAKPNTCVFKCFANVSKPKEENLKPTGITFQLLGPATAKDLKPQMTRNNNVTMSSRSQIGSTKHQRSTSAIVGKISRGRTTEAVKHNHAQLIIMMLEGHSREDSNASPFHNLLTIYIQKKEYCNPNHTYMSVLL